MSTAATAATPAQHKSALGIRREEFLSIGEQGRAQGFAMASDGVLYKDCFYSLLCLQTRLQTYRVRGKVGCMFGSSTQTPTPRKQNALGACAGVQRRTCTHLARSHASLRPRSPPEMQGVFHSRYTANI
jgi:hypothetical protein